MHSLNVLQMCVFNAHVIYKSFEGLTKVLSYFNALKERLHKSPKIYSLRNIFLCVTDRSQPTRCSVLGLTDRSLPTRSSASSADGPRLLQPTRPMLSLYLNKVVVQAHVSHYVVFYTTLPYLLHSLLSARVSEFGFFHPMS